jgi:hypothetical protein
MRDAFRFSRRAGRVEDDERIFGGGGFGILAEPFCRWRAWDIIETN